MPSEAGGVVGGAEVGEGAAGSDDSAGQRRRGFPLADDAGREAIESAALSGVAMFGLAATLLQTAVPTRESGEAAVTGTRNGMRRSCHAPTARLVRARRRAGVGGSDDRQRRSARSAVPRPTAWRRRM